MELASKQSKDDKGRADSSGRRDSSAETEEDDRPSTRRQLTDSRRDRVFSQVQPWGFFDNQLFETYPVDFGDQVFYGDGWKTIMGMELPKHQHRRHRFQFLFTEATIEPRSLTALIKEGMQEKREELQRRSNEDHVEIDLEEIVSEQEKEKFQEYFQTIKKDDEEDTQNYESFTCTAFNEEFCKTHRNAMEIFPYNKNYFLVTKTFLHKKAAGELNMKIFKFVPTHEVTAEEEEDENYEEPGISQCCEVQGTSVDSANCLDPSMISVVHYRQWLYYFVTKNKTEDGQATGEIVFSLHKFDMETEEESLVRDYLYSSPADAGDPNRSSELATKKAYAAVFIENPGTANAETEEEFIGSQLVALLLEAENDGETGKSDDKFQYRIRKLGLWQVDLFIEDERSKALACNSQFKIKWYDEASIMQKECCVFIWDAKVKVIAIDSKESSLVTQAEEIHYSTEKSCFCCDSAARQLADSLKRELATSLIQRYGNSSKKGFEHLRSQIIEDQELVTAMIRHLEDKPELEVHPKEAVVVLQDPRTYRYLIIYNAQLGDERSEVTICESAPAVNIRSSEPYDEMKLTPFVRYIYDAREKFLEERGMSKEFHQHRQMFSLFNNVIVESRFNKDNVSEIVIAYEQANEERTMHVAIDDAMFYTNSFSHIHLSQKVQFLQQTDDDRKILPRVIKDSEKHRFLFQIYKYKTDEEVKEEQRAKFNLDDEDVDPAEIRRQEDEKRIIQTLPIDISTMDITDFQNIEAHMAPCTSVYLQAFGQAARHYVQDFQVLITSRNCQILRIYVYRVFWAPTGSKVGEPYSVTAQLVGHKLLFLKPGSAGEEQSYKTGFYSLYNNQRMDIYGTQLILNKELVINMPNFKRDEYLFDNDVARSGYKRYINKNTLNKDAILFESYLAEVLSCREQFTEADHILLLRYQLRMLMNMIPYSLITSLSTRPTIGNFFQPMEVLAGQNLLAYCIHDPHYLHSILKPAGVTPSDLLSLIDEILKDDDLSEEVRAKIRQEDYFLPDSREVSRDPICSNPLLECFETSPPLQASLEKILKYLFAGQATVNESLMLMEAMPHILSLDEASQEFSKFFIDSTNAEINIDRIGARMAVALDDPDLPPFSNNSITISEFQDTEAYLYISDVKHQVSASLKNQKLDALAQIPVRHTYVDFRAQVLGQKLARLAAGAEIGATELDELVLAHYLYRICAVYGNDIEFQDSTRNLIEDLYEKNKHVQTLLFAYYTAGYLLPLVLQIFVFEEEYQIKGCQIICLFTVLLISLYTLLQLRGFGTDYFKKPFHLNTLALCLTYYVYIGFKFRDDRNYLPGYVQAGLEAGTVARYATEEREVWRIALISVLHIALLFTAALKVLEFLKVYQQFYNLIYVLRNCFVQILPFLFLFFVWVIMISCCLRVLGMDRESAEGSLLAHETMGDFAVFVISAFRTAIGDSQQPAFSFWENRQETFWSASQAIITFIWFVWFCNQVMMFIFALNFLVAMISQIYEQSMASSMIEKYTYKCDKVREAAVVNEVFGLGRTLLVFSISFTTNMRFNEWTGLVQTLREYIRGENLLIKTKLNEKVKNLEESISGQTEFIKDKVDYLFNKMQTVNLNLEGRIDSMQSQFDELKQLIRVLAEADAKSESDSAETIQGRATPSLNDLGNINRVASLKK